LPYQEKVMLHVQTILHPTDFSPCSQDAFRLACALAEDYAARLVVLHVAAPPAFFYGEGTLVGHSPEHLAQLGEQLTRVRPRDPGVAVEYRLTEGDPATEILHVATETGSDVIVLGTHGRTGLGRLLMGSVAEDVLRKARCPVVTAKGPVRETAPPAPPGPQKVEMVEVP
jgi:nucleotide-binding universal stress UspA family protein